jgi:hypothetical protein
MAKIDENETEISQTVAVPGTMENEVELQGMITSVLSAKRGAIVNISCGYRGMRRDENGRFNRNQLQVVFLNKDDINEGDYYAKRFSHGDTVIIHAVAQTVYNHTEHKSHTELWGLSMEKTDDKLITGYDKNDIHVTGKVYNLVVRGNGWFTVFVTTKVKKTHLNKVTSGYTITRDYRSVLPISIHMSDRELKRVNIEDRLTKGTWVDIKGYLRDHTTKDNVRLCGIVGNDINIIGDSQPKQPLPDYKSREEEQQEAETDVKAAWSEE